MTHMNGKVTIVTGGARGIGVTTYTKGIQK